MARGRMMLVLALVAGLAAGWHYRARLKALLWPLPSAAHPASPPDVLYTWVDSNGVTHYTQESGRGRRVEYDGSRITPLAPPPPLPAAAAPPAAGASSLHALRQELQDDAARMQAAKAAASPDL